MLYVRGLIALMLAALLMGGQTTNTPAGSADGDDGQPHFIGTWYSPELPDVTDQIGWHYARTVTFYPDGRMHYDLEHPEVEPTDGEWWMESDYRVGWRGDRPPYRRGYFDVSVAGRVLETSEGGSAVPPRRFERVD